MSIPENLKSLHGAEEQLRDRALALVGDDARLQLHLIIVERATLLLPEDKEATGHALGWARDSNRKNLSAHVPSKNVKCSDETARA